MFAGRSLGGLSLALTGWFLGLVTLNQLRQMPPAERARTTLAQATCPLPQVPACHPRRAPRRRDRPTTYRLQRGRALVFDNGRLVGILSARDVMRALQWAGLSPAGAALRIMRPP